MTTAPQLQVHGDLKTQSSWGLLKSLNVEHWQTYTPGDDAVMMLFPCTKCHDAEVSLERFTDRMTTRVLTELHSA